MKPPMIPHQGRAIDTVNFRNVKESGSIDGGNRGGTAGAFSVSPAVAAAAAAAAATQRGSQMKGVPLDSGLATPGGEMADPFEEFNSVTLHHDGEEGR